MKRKFIMLTACLFATTAFAQIESESKEVDNIDWQEDTTEIVTIADIMRDEQEVTMRKNVQKHYDDVWSRRSYFNISSTKNTLTPKDKIYTGVNATDIVPEFKSDWGVALTWGRNYRLHKPSIANVAQFNIDYTWIDFNVNHFKAEGDKNLYDSRHKFNEEKGPDGSWVGWNSNNRGSDGSSYNSSTFKKAKNYTPWNIEKYEANYGMSLGPSLTLAPFTYIDVPALHHIQMNIYYHIGYQASIIMMKNDSDLDVNQKELGTGTNGYDEDLQDALGDHAVLDFGHGMTSTFGFSLWWKFVGFGFESRKSTLEYQSLSESDFGKDKYKFESAISRVYLQFRF